MNRARTIFPILCLLALLPLNGYALDCWDTGRRVRQEASGCRYCVDPNIQQFCIVNYDFEVLNWQGWTSVDNTDPGPYWHADDYTGCAWFAPVPLADSLSGWCGAGSTATPVKAWGTPPGYGNKWDQLFISDTITVWASGGVSIRFKYYVDCELDEDYFVLEFLNFTAGTCNVIQGPFSGTVCDSVSGSGSVAAGDECCFRFRFVSDWACSDQDGGHNSDGGAHIDDIRISFLGNPIDVENFENAIVGFTTVDSDSNGFCWHAESNKYGIFAGLFQWLQDKDPCNENLNSQVTFFGLVNPSTAYPGLFDTPYCSSAWCEPFPCQDEMIISPMIDLTRYSTNCDDTQDMAINPILRQFLGGATLEFSVYRDLSLSGLVFYYWKMRKMENDEEPLEGWRDRGFLYYGGRDEHGPTCCSENDYIVSSQSFGDMYANDKIQLAIGVIDMYKAFSSHYGTGLGHTPSPWIDDVKIVRYQSIGPQWFYRSIDLFQDNFSRQAGGTVRADAAIDVAEIDALSISPRDYICVTCGAPAAGGLDSDANGDKVFIHVRTLWIGPGSMPYIVGPALVGTYGAYVSNDAHWTVIQGAPAPGACPATFLDDMYAFDLNDALLTPGYMIEYYFSAVDKNGTTSYLPAGADTLDDHPQAYYGRSNWFEFTCLPTGDGDILYVDDFHDRLSLDGEAHDNLDDAFMAVLPLESQPDRFDVNGPSSMVSNSLASRAHLDTLLLYYRTIIWDSGNLRNGTICDGTTGDKSRDCQMLTDWLDQSEMNPGLWVLGDNVAWDLNSQATSLQAALLLNTQCGVSFKWDSYYEISAIENPSVSSSPISIFNPSLDPFCVYGSCPNINAFDCLDTIGDAEYALDYPSVATNDYHAAINNMFINSNENEARTIWFGFSYMYTRGCEVSPQVKYDLMTDAMNYLYQPVNAVITGGGEETPAYVTSLRQNYPNPFNPATSIDFSLKERGRATLRIYDVSGRLVRTLVDGDLEPGPHRASWDGANNLGRRVASGIYFYRMEADEFIDTKKMILLR